MIRTLPDPQDLINADESVAEVAKLGVALHRNTVLKYGRLGRLTTYRIGDKKIYFDRNEVRALLQPMTA